jgi:hypothetical protein
VDGRKMAIEEKGECVLFPNQEPTEVSITSEVEEPLFSVPDINVKHGMTTVMDDRGVRFVKGHIDVPREKLLGEGPLVDRSYLYNPADTFCERHRDMARRGGKELTDKLVPSLRKLASSQEGRDGLEEILKEVLQMKRSKRKKRSQRKLNPKAKKINADVVSA